MSDSTLTHAAHPAPRRALVSTTSTEPLTLPQTLVRMGLVAAGAALFTLVMWFALSRVTWPAYNYSNVLRAVSSAGIILVVLVSAIANWLWLYPTRLVRNTSATSDDSDTRTVAATVPRGPQQRRLRVLIHVALYMAPAVLVVATLAIPLAGTRLYLDGVSIDQGFRNQFFARMTDQLGWSDMAYADMPSFYPGLWFFAGGAFAKATGLAAWVAFKPWSLITLAVTAAILVPVWQRLLGSLVLANAIALATTAVMLHIAPDEPYAAIVAMGMPAAFLMSRRALEGGNWTGIAGIIIYLGLSANLYTLYTGISALTVVAMACTVAWTKRSAQPLLRLVIIGFSSMVLALVGWGPYLFALLSRPHGPTGTAQHYLPVDSTILPVPFFDNQAFFLLGVVALVWLVAKFREATAQSLAVGAVVAYAWVLGSMLITLFGTTLLSFRIALPISIIFAVTSMIALADLRGSVLRQLFARLGAKHHLKTVSTVLVVLLSLSLVHYMAQTQDNLRERIVKAYEETDGSGIRADGSPADDGAYFADIDRILQQHTGSRAGTVVLTDEKNFLAYYPYHSYQAMTAHYANPLGEFSRRNEVIESWTSIKDPGELTAAMDKAGADNGWEKPRALILRAQKDSDEKWGYLIADDIYPNSPNVRFRQVDFHASAFATGWHLEQVGPFVVAIRE